MKLLRFLLINIFLISLSFGLVYSQDIMKKKKSGEAKYLLRDSTGSYLIKELTSPDGTKSYSLIPKSYLEDTLGADKNLPQSLKDWFYKNKKRSGTGGLLLSEDKDSLNYLLGKQSKSDTTAAANQKKNKGAWWIVGTTTVIGGVIAYIFLQYRKGVDELPIQPDPPK